MSYRNLFNNWEIEDFRDANGTIPFREWIKRLDPSIGLRVLDRINRMRDGNFGDYKHTGDGIFELRLHFGSGYRVYYAISGNRIILLLCGGDKSSQKNDIAKAKDYWKFFKEQMK